jgi:hypothetical protein
VNTKRAVAFVDAVFAEARLLKVLIDVGGGNKEVVGLSFAQSKQDIEPSVGCGSGVKLSTVPIKAPSLLWIL